MGSPARDRPWRDQGGAVGAYAGRRPLLSGETVGQGHVGRWDPRRGVGLLNVFVESPSASADWPYSLIPWGTLGHLRMADGGGVRIIGWTRQGHDGQLTFHPPADEAARVREAVAKGGVWALIFGHNADGSLAVFEMAAEPQGQDPAVDPAQPLAST